ncbi:hypothetical protein AB0383_26380, partial [Amycolatopsis sp. NPDC051373]
DVGGSIGPRPIRPPTSGSRLKGDLARPGEAGAKDIARETPYGDFRAMVRDPSGNVFQLAARKA